MQTSPACENRVAGSWLRGSVTGRAIAVTLLALSLIAATAPAASADNERVVDSALTAGWSTGALQGIAVGYDAQEDSSVTGLTVDVFIDDTSIHHSTCECSMLGERGERSGILQGEPMASYDPSNVSDGSSHTLRVVVTELPSGTEQSDIWAFTIDKTAPT